MMIESLENRRLMSVDLSLKALSSNLPASVESTALSKIKSVTAKVTVVNSGTEALPKTFPAVDAKIYLKSSTGVETLIGTAKAAKYGGLKANGTKPVTVKCTLPSGGLAQGTYTLEAKVDTNNAATESDETNNTATGAATSVVPGGTALFAQYGFADSMTFTRTQLDGTTPGSYSEEGTFVDANGVGGQYIFTATKVIGSTYFTSLSLGLHGLYIMAYHGKLLTTTLNGRHAAFSAKGNGGVKVDGGPTASGNKIFCKIT